MTKKINIKQINNAALRTMNSLQKIVQIVAVINPAKHVKEDYLMINVQVVNQIVT